MAIDVTHYGKHLKAILSLYDKLLDEQGFSGLVIPSGIPKMQFLDDNSYPYKVNVHFKALLPVTDAPHSYIIYQPGSKPQLAFYQPEDYWHVVPSDPEGIWVDYFDIRILRNKTEWQNLLPKQTNTLAWLGETETGLSETGIVHINPEKLMNPIHYNRAYKSEYEVACMREANLLAAKGHLAAKEAFYAGASEFEIHLAYLKASSQKEEALPYGNIVALNQHGAVLHYTELDVEPCQTDKLHSFLLDAGATFNGYCSDITRTWSYRDDEFNELIQRFDKIQLDLIAELSAGKSYVDMHILTHLKISEFMKDAGFIHCDAEMALKTGISSTFFPHGLGHLLGLQVHDIGGHQTSPTGEITSPPEAHPFLRMTKTLEPGFCVTIEPGMYFIDLLLDKLRASEHASLVNWSRVEAFKKYGGIRIEDDVVITEQGSENLSRAAFESLANGD